MLLNKNLPQKFWAEAVNTSCHIGNRIYFRAGTKKTLYEIWRDSRAYRVYNKHTKTVMESINVVIDDTISEKGIDNDGEGQTLKKNEDMSQGENAEKESQEEESTPPIPRWVTRSTQGSPSPLTPLEVQPSISRDEEPSTSKRPSSRVILNHPSSNIIVDLDEKLQLRKG